MTRRRALGQRLPRARRVTIPARTAPVAARTTLELTANDKKGLVIMVFENAMNAMLTPAIPATGRNTFA